MEVRVGTRGSKLALWQAHHLQSLLNDQGVASSLKIIKTKGDQIQDIGFSKIEGKGFFTKEIEDALLDGAIDVAVHSMKDLPTSMVEELRIGALSSRADPADILIIGRHAYDPARRTRIRAGALIGTSSIRRKVQLLHFDNSLLLTDIRGNVPTRIRKIDEGIVDAVVLAKAGIDRLNIDLTDYETLSFNPCEFVPAPAQGVNAYQCRSDDKAILRILKKVHHKEVANCTNIERLILRQLDGGCQLPLGVYVTHSEMGYHAHAVLGTTPGEPLKRYHYSQSTSVGMAEHIVLQLKS